MTVETLPQPFSWGLRPPGPIHSLVIEKKLRPMALRERERFLEANKKCGTQSDLGSAACRLPAGAGVGTVAEMVVGTVGTVAEMVVEGVEYVIRLASRAGERERESRCRMSLGRRRSRRRRRRGEIRLGRKIPSRLDRVHPGLWTGWPARTTPEIVTTHFLPHGQGARTASATPGHGV